MPQLQLQNRTSFNFKRGLIVTLAIALVGTVVLFRSFAATVTEPSQGLFIQVSSLAPTTTPQQLQSWLEEVRINHRGVDGKSGNPNPGYINDLVIQDIADANGNLLTNYLDVIAPYLPGGAKKSFDRVFVGTVDLSWSGAGSKYIEGIKDKTFQDSNISLSDKAARAFVQRYPTAQINWYITYEANLAGFWDSSIETSYASYIDRLSTTLSAVSPNKTFMWSPAFWTPLRNEPSWALPDLKTNLNHLFTSFKYPIAFNLQDFVGQSNGVSTKDDAVAWINYLKTNITKQPASLSVNTEQFIQSPAGAITVGDSNEVPARENYYASQGIKLGPAWEMRYWYKRVTSGATAPATAPAPTK